jgi:hypothetical protein
MILVVLMEREGYQEEINKLREQATSKERMELLLKAFASVLLPDVVGIGLLPAVLCKIGIDAVNWSEIAEHLCNYEEMSNDN